jgi:hypothetical protein
MFAVESVIGSRVADEATLGADGLVLVDILAHVLTECVEVNLCRTNFCLAF